MIMKKKSLQWLAILIIGTTTLFTGCQSLQSEKANISKANVSQTIFSQFKEDGFATLDEAEKAAIDMYIKKDFKAMVDHSTAESMIEGTFQYDGTADFYAYFIDYLKSSSGDAEGRRVYNNPQLVQAWKEKDGMSAHYQYKFTNNEGKEVGAVFAIVNKNGKFLLDYTIGKYIFEELFFKFSSGKDIAAKLVPDPHNPSNVILPIALEKCVDQEVARPWKIWMAVSSQHRMQVKSFKFVTDNGSFDVEVDSKMGPEGAILNVEVPIKFGKIKQATATDKNDRTYEFKIIDN